MTKRILRDEEATEETVETAIVDDGDLVRVERVEDGKVEEGTPATGLSQAKKVVHLEIAPGVWIDKMA